jgi:hypothetical protein
MTDLKRHRHCKYFERVPPSSNGICLRFPPTGCAVMVAMQPQYNATGNVVGQLPVYEPRGVFPPVTALGTACGEFVERAEPLVDELPPSIDLPDTDALKAIADAAKSETKQ